MVESQTSNMQGYSQYNPQVNESSLRLRLDTDKLLMGIETDLRGEIIQVYEQDNELKTIRTSVGQRKCNDRGVQDIMKFLRSLVNPSTTQGNLKIEDFDDFIKDKHLDLGKNLFVNFPNYDMREEDMQPIISDAMSTVLLNVSRTIDNKERESYQQTVKHTENQTIEGKKGILPF